jgi:hypothetical protein
MNPYIIKNNAASLSACNIQLQENITDKPELSPPVGKVKLSVLKHNLWEAVVEIHTLLTLQVNGSNQHYSLDALPQKNRPPVIIQ